MRSVVLSNYSNIPSCFLNQDKSTYQLVKLKEFKLLK